jgi:RNA cap guanine-N2 methyltransferase
VDNQVQIINKDFLTLQLEDIKYPEGRPANIDVLFMSPPWGGVGYNMLEEYKLEYLYPNFTEVVKKALEFSRNLIFFLPKNTSIEQIVDSLVPFAQSFVDDPETKKNQLVIEIEQIVYGTSCKGIHIYTGDVASVDPKEMVEYFYEKYC